MRYEIDGVRLNGQYHYTLYDDNDSSIKSISKNDESDISIINYNTGWSICTKQPEELQPLWIEAVQKYQSESGIQGPVDLLHKYIQDVRDFFALDMSNWPEHQSLTLPAIGSAMSILESYENCSDETIEKIMNAGLGPIPSFKESFAHAWKATKYNVGLDVRKTLYTLEGLGVSVFIDPVLDTVDTTIDLICGPINAIYVEVSRVFADIITKFKELQKTDDEEVKKNLMQICWDMLISLGKTVYYEYIYQLLCIDTFTAIFKQLKQLWNTKEEIWRALIAQLKSLVDFDYKALNSELINKIADNIIAFLPLLGALIGAFVAKGCVEESLQEADRQMTLDNRRRAEGRPGSEGRTYEDDIADANNKLRAASIVYTFACNNNHDFSLYSEGTNKRLAMPQADKKEYDAEQYTEKTLLDIYNELQDSSIKLEDIDGELDGLSIDELSCKVSICPTSPPIDPTEFSGVYFPEKLTIEFSKEFPNAYFTVSEGQHVNVGDIIGYINEIKVISKYKFIVDYVDERYIIGTYEYDSAFYDASSNEDEIRENAESFINNLTEQYYNDDDYNSMFDGLMDNMRFETYVMNYLLYCRFPDLALNCVENLAPMSGSGLITNNALHSTKASSIVGIASQGYSIEECIEKYAKIADDLKDKYNDEFKKVAGKDNVKDKSSNGHLIALKKEIDGVKQRMIDEIMSFYNTSPENTGLRSKGTIEDFLLYNSYLEYLLSDKFMYDEDNTYIVKLYNTIVEFLSIRQQIELNEDNIDSLIKKFNEYCAKNIQSMWTNKERDYYAFLSNVFKYDYYKAGDDILEALSTDKDKTSRYNKVYNYLLSLANLPADKKQEISLGENDDVSKILETASTQEAAFDKDKIQMQQKLQKVAIYFNTLRIVEQNIKTNSIEDYASENDIDLEMMKKYAKKDDVLSYYKGERNAFGALTRTYLAPYLETLMNIARDESAKLNSIINENFTNYNKIKAETEPFTLLNKFIEMPWPGSSLLFYQNDKSDFFLFAETNGVNIPPTSFEELEEMENNPERGRANRGPDEMLDNLAYGESAYGINSIQYWLKYCGIATLVHCCLPMYWSTGLVIPPIPYIPLPVIYIPMIVTSGRVSLVIGLGLCGIMPLPMILIVNTGKLNGCIIPPINMLVDMLINTTKQLTNLPRPAINASIDPIINMLNDEISNLETEIDVIKYQSEQLNAVNDTPKHIQDALAYSYQPDFTTNAIQKPAEFIKAGSIGTMSNDYYMDMAANMTDYFNKSWDEIKDQVAENYKKSQEMVVINNSSDDGDDDIDMNYVNINGSIGNVNSANIVISNSGKAPQGVVHSDVTPCLYPTSSIKFAMKNKGCMPKYIVIHYTAGGNSLPGTAKATRNAWIDNDKVGADFAVDDETMVQFNPNPDYYWAVASAGGGYPDSNGGGSHKGISHQYFLNIEVCSTINQKIRKNSRYPKAYPAANSPVWYFTNKTLVQALKLSAILMKKYNIPIENVIRHYDTANKLCPGIIGWNKGPLYNLDYEKLETRNTEEKWLAWKAELNKLVSRL